LYFALPMAERGIGIIGCGAWGRHYLRVFHEDRGARVVACADPRRDALDAVRRQFPLVQVAPEPGPLIQDPAVQAVVVATPASTHPEVARCALEAGKDVLVEKPLALNARDCEALTALAARHGRILMIGHTFLYNDSVRLVRDLTRRPDFGRIYYMVARRTNLGPVRDDVSALWDLAPHDVSIFAYLAGAPPLAVNAVARGFLSSGRPDVAFLTLHFPADVVGQIQVSWIDSQKVRDVVVIGDRSRIVFDDLNLTESVRIYEKGISVRQSADTYGEFQYLQRDGAIISPKVDRREPLKNLVSEFLACCESRRAPLADGAQGTAVVRVLEACERSIAAEGRRVEVAA
jgi:predicted dehydrogenase